MIVSSRLRIACGLALLAGLVAPSGTRAAGDSPDVRVAHWREDVRFLREELPKRHPGFATLVDRKRFDSVLDSLDRSAATLTDAQFLTGLVLAGAMTDAHTGVVWLGSEAALPRLPIALSRFEEGWYVFAADTTLMELVGSRVTAIGGAGIEEVARRLAPFIPHDTSWWLLAQLGTAMTSPALLAAAGVPADPARVTLSLADDSGARRDVDVEAVADSTVHWTTYERARGTEPALARRRPNANYWFAEIPDARALLIRYNRAVDDASLPFDAFTRDVLAWVDDHRPGKIVIDLRANPGGSSRLLSPLMDGLKRRGFARGDGRLVALIGRRTCSSATLNAIELRGELRAVLVGEPSGGRPNTWGELQSFRLPNSHLIVTHSTRYFRAVSGDPPLLEPKVRVPLRWSDFRAARDPALDAALGVR